MRGNELKDPHNLALGESWKSIVNEEYSRIRRLPFNANDF